MKKLTKIPFFQTLNAIFCYLGVFAQNVNFLILFSFWKRIILIPILTWADTPNMFFGFFSDFSNIFVWYFFFIWIFGELRELCAKFWNFWVNIHRDIICQSRLLLTPFFNCCIVQCMVDFYVWLYFPTNNRQLTRNISCLVLYEANQT